MAPVPPVALSAARYSSPTTPFVRASVEIASAPSGSMTIVMAFVAVRPRPSVAFTVNVSIPSVRGVPLMTPALLRLRSPSDPDANSHVMAPVPPVVLSAARYSSPTLPFVSVAVEITGASSAALIVMEKFLVSLHEPQVAVTVKSCVPAAVGLPSILPVAASNVSPPGRSVLLHTMAPVILDGSDFVAVSGMETSVPTLPVNGPASSIVR